MEENGMGQEATIRIAKDGGIDELIRNLVDIMRD